MKDVVLDEVMKELIISKRDFENYFKKVFTKSSCLRYL